MHSSRRTALRLLAGASLLPRLELKAQSPSTSLAPEPSVTPFRVSIPESALIDLRNRLRNTRWPERETVQDWSQGVPLAKAKALAQYWQNQYDWRKFERRLNSFPQFRTDIDGLGFHFLHVRSSHPDALPLILTHGWPGSIVEFLDVIGPLTEPTQFGGTAQDAFHVVIPSLPGFGFSDKPSKPGWNAGRVANAWVVLMKRLGYTRWVAQGGDWGSGVTHTLAHRRPEGLLAAHVNLPFVFPDQLPAKPTPEEKRAIEAATKLVQYGFGYFAEQGQSPQTIGYGLMDSPIAQACWIYEKFYAWTDNRGQPEDALSVDQMLNDISLYWFTATAASSARYYWESGRGYLPVPAGFAGGRIELPMAATVFPREFYRAPKAWAEASWPNLIYWNEVDHGGHFAAFEQPVIFTNELRKAFSSVRA